MIKVGTSPSSPRLMKLPNPDQVKHWPADLAVPGLRPVLGGNILSRKRGFNGHSRSLSLFNIAVEKDIKLRNPSNPIQGTGSKHGQSNFDS